MKILVNSVLIILTLLVFGYGSFKLYEGPLFRIKNFHIKLNNNSSNKVLFGKIKKNIQRKINSLKGSSLIILDLNKIKKTLLSDHRVESFELFRRFPNQLYIEILPKSARAILLSKGKINLVTQSGSIFLAEIDAAYDMPVLNGKLLGQNKIRRAKVILFLKEISKNDLFNKKNISEVSFTKSRGLVVFLNSGLQVFLGKKDVVNKSMRVDKVLRYLKSNAITCRAIDASFSKKVVVRLRNES